MTRTTLLAIISYLNHRDDTLGGPSRNDYVSHMRKKKISINNEIIIIIIFLTFSIV